MSLMDIDDENDNLKIITHWTTKSRLLQKLTLWQHTLQNQTLETEHIILTKL